MFNKALFTLVTAVALLSSLPAQAVTGMYMPYEPTAFKEAANLHRVLFFHADWCSFCKAADSKLQSVSLPNDVMVFKVDYDKANDLRTKYGVTQQHTFVLVDAQGNKLAQWIGLENAQADHFMAPPEGNMMGKEKMMMQDDKMMMKEK